MKKITVCFFVFSMAFGAMSPQKPIVLSLNDAIYLAVRNNTNLYSAKLDRITQKYALVVAKNEFEPHYAFSSSVGRSWENGNGVKGIENSVEGTPSVELKSHWGTKVSAGIDSTRTWPGDYGSSITFSVRQPLLKGFGRAVVDAALNDAIDAARLDKLSFKNKAESTVVLIINDYLTVVSDQKNLQIDRLTLESDKTTLKNTQALVDAGRRAGVDLIQPQTDLAQQQSTIHKDIETVRNDTDRLLDDLALSHDTKIIILNNIDFEAVANQLRAGKLPSSSRGQQIALDQSGDYQGGVNALRSAGRELVSAKNGRLWDLALVAKNVRSTNNDSEISRLTNFRNYNESIGAELTIPIDDVNTKQTLIAAQVELKKAIRALQQGARSLQRTVLNQYDSLEDLKMQIQYSEHSLKLQQENVRLAELQYNLGKMSALDYSTLKKSLTTKAQDVVATRINYINALAQLTQTLGMTLDCFGIKIRY